MPVAVTHMAGQPILRVATRSVGRPQSDSVPAVNDGISMTFQSENKITNTQRVVERDIVLDHEQICFLLTEGDE